jgi:hypothetical protein
MSAPLLAPFHGEIMMSIVQRISLTAAVLAVVASAALATSAPAEAKNRSIYNDKQNWRLVDQNHDGVISKTEWKYAEKHGYDRLNGVSKKHLTRNEYQSYLDEYLGRRYASNGASWNKKNQNNAWRNWDNNRQQWDDDRPKQPYSPYLRRSDGGWVGQE